jgi:hypothetical protein
LVVHPRDVSFRQLLEDTALGKTVDKESIIVFSMAVGRSRREVRTVRVGGTGDGGKPAVEEDKVLGHGVEDPDLVWGVVVDHLGRSGSVEGIEGDGLLGDETAHSLVFDLLVDEFFIWVPGAEDWKGVRTMLNGITQGDERCMLTPLMLWFGSSAATSFARGPAHTSSC